MELKRRLQSLARLALHQIFPPRCVGCDDYLASDTLSCERCANAIFAIDGPMCRICGHPRQKVRRGYAGVDDVCGRCLQRRPRFESARARWEYEGVIAEALQRAKYRGQLWALRSLARQLRPWLAEQVARCGDPESTVLTAVPMHPADLRRRGFNAALLLGRLALPHRRLDTQVVQKTRRTSAQAGLTRGERLTNLRGAFACPRPALVEGKTVVLFDDVMTTGATADQVARVLRRAGARKVVVLTAARSVSA